MSSIVFLDTRTSQTTSNYDTYWKLYFAALNNVSRVRIKLLSVEFPNAVYSVNAYNNIIYFTEYNGVAESSVLTATIPSGNYTGTTLATAIGTAMTSVSTYGFDYTTSSYDTNQLKMTITFDQVSPNYFKFVLGFYTIYEHIGFDQDTFDETFLSKTSDFPVNIAGTRYIDIISNLSTSNFAVGGDAHVLQRIPILVPFGNIVFWENQNHDDGIEVLTQFIDEIRITLRDDKFNYYELPDNAHFSMSIQITPIRE